MTLVELARRVPPTPRTATFASRCELGSAGGVFVNVMIRLLGPPVIERAGEVVPSPRGRKAWAVLAFVALADRPVSRVQLASLLFGDASDPLGAVRWTLAELRRSLGMPGVLQGDPVALGVPTSCIDVTAVLEGDAMSLLAGRGELLEGLHVDGCAVFESWLVVERYRMSAIVEAGLRQEACTLLSIDRAADALPFAARLVASDVLDEANHELLVRCLAAVGDEAAALRQVAVCEDVLARELGVAVSPALRTAARRREHGASVPVSGRSEVKSLLQAGRAAVAAGAVEAGLDCLQRAAGKSSDASDRQLQAQALLSLGAALVHSVRGRDGEGSVVLHEALRVADLVGDDDIGASARRELAFVEVQAGRRVTAREWLAQASGRARCDRERAAIFGVQGMNASDMGDYAGATLALETSVELSLRCGDARQEAWSLSILARAHLLCGEPAQGLVAVRRSLAIVDDQRWLAFAPWPRALLAELEMLGSADEVGVAQLEQAYALSRQLGDPCWEGMTARLLGLVASRRGDVGSATEWLEDARRRAGAVTDPYQWVRAYVLDAAIEVAVASGHRERARALTAELATLAARCDMRELVVRSCLHSWRLGDPDALKAARLLAIGIDNPALRQVLERAEQNGSR